MRSTSIPVTVEVKHVKTGKPKWKSIVELIVGSVFAIMLYAGGVDPGLDQWNATGELGGLFKAGLSFIAQVYVTRVAMNAWREL